MFETMQSEMGVVIIATFVSIFFFLLSLISFRSMERDKVSSRLKKYTTPPEKGDAAKRKKGNCFAKKTE